MVIVVKNVANEICNNFIEDKVLEINPLGAGHINDTYIVKTVACDYVLQRIQKGMNISHLEHNYALYSDVLDKCNLLYPKWMMSQDGNHYFIDENSNAWRMYPYIEGDVLSQPLTKNMLHSFGEGLARLHHAFRMITEKPIAIYPNLGDLNHYYQKYNKIVTMENVSNSFRDSQIEEQIEQLSKHFLEHNESSDSDELTDLPAFHDGTAIHSLKKERQTIIHADTKLSNVLFKDGNVIGFIDFDTIMLGTITADISDAIRSCCIKNGKPDKEDVDSLVDGYLSVSDAETAEEVTNNLQHDFNKQCFELALRYYIDLVSEENHFKDKEPYEKLERVKILLGTII